jgi:hypothetical protein
VTLRIASKSGGFTTTLDSRVPSPGKERDTSMNCTPSRLARGLVCLTLTAAASLGCGGTTAGVSNPPGVSTLSALESGALEQRVYVGVDNDLTIGASPVLTTMGLLGGGQVELEVVTPDGSPIEFEVWRTQRDGVATLEIPVEASSGFALEDIDPEETGTWALLFPRQTSRAVIVHMDCVGGLYGCAQSLQPGESCPAGWTCDTGLSCELPIGVCGPLAGIGTCVPTPTSCTEDTGAVCGCDGRTYPSECDARVAGAPILHAQGC